MPNGCLRRLSPSRKSCRRVLGRLDRNELHLEPLDPRAFDLENGEPKTVERRLVAGLGRPPDQAEHHAAHRVEVLVGDLDVELLVESLMENVPSMRIRPFE